MLRLVDYFVHPWIFASMFYVYMLQSLSNTDRMYVGFTQHLKHRLEEHNSSECVHTLKYMPWKLHTFIGFESKEKALVFWAIASKSSWLLHSIDFSSWIFCFSSLFLLYKSCSKSTRGHKGILNPKQDPRGSIFSIFNTCNI